MGAIRYWIHGKDKKDRHMNDKPEVWSSAQCEARVKKAMQQGATGINTLFSNAGKWLDEQADKEYGRSCLKALMAAYDRLCEPMQKSSFFD